MSRTKNLPVAEAVRLEIGETRDRSTLHAWATRGGRYGIRLETKMVGGRRVTSRAAVRRFIDARTAAANGVQKAAG